MLYVIPEPLGEVTVMLPVKEAHDGCVTVTTGCEGTGGAALMTA
ncbi:MAG: hypothetical protein RL213_2170, partial [Bacteroidota bacterium]